MARHPVDLGASIDDLDLPGEIARRLKEIGATTIGTVYLMDYGDFIARLGNRWCGDVIYELGKHNIKPKSETMSLKKRVEVFKNIIHLPVGYLQVLGVITGLQRQALEDQGIRTWGELASLTERMPARLAVNGQAVFTATDIRQVQSFLIRHDIIPEW